ncbi:MAG: bifunctional proline dehydrogenase/L-glutamate gamma-semialdehyde dehydrogenase [Campylobacterales bacterium]|nr:bifunctional proline dehydrogenase/L-glutamate gamma-semialdehyde dehydrogenase [Campylobacterales bacterium]
MNASTSLTQRAIALAEQWQNRASELVNAHDNKFHVQMNTMLAHPLDKVLLIELMDQAFRSKNTKRVANQIEFLFDKYGMAQFFTTSERFLMFLFRTFGVHLPDISIPLFVKTIRSDTKTVVLQGEEGPLNAHLEKRKKEGTRVNVNLIGEVVLGEEEAKERMEKYLLALENPNIDYMSIKISTIFSQINPLAFEESVEELSKRLQTIYAQATKHAITTREGKKQNKFINLDMEEYRDLAMTCEAFMKALESEEFLGFYGGIVMQAYLPDSHLWQQKLTQWAKARVAKGGSPIKIRLVKGANMEMEETESSLRHWEVAPYARKVDTDSNYKRMARYALTPENAPCVHLGAASHNLFELAYAYELAKENGVEQYFTFEILEGMSESARLAIQEMSGEVILYGPTAKAEQFTNAIAYLVRRLDENTGVENFIRYSFGLKVGSPAWEEQKQKFLDAIDNEPNAPLGPKRLQNRLEENWENYQGGSFSTKAYHGEPDTDFILPANKAWAKQIRDQWKKSAGDVPTVRPVVVDGKELIGERKKVEVKDKSQLPLDIVCGVYVQATAEDLHLAVEVAHQDPDGWRALTPDQRHEALSRVANVVRARRGDLIGVAAAELGKVFTETDVEVSEAIDFLEYYTHAVRSFERPALTCKGKGVGVVVPPWNFPIAIPLGGIAASLAAGNTVIIKPASIAVLSAHALCQCFWDAGISKNVLQMVPCAGSVAGEHLISNEKVDFVILTGGEETAYAMLETRPDLYLSAETGGKDATIVTALADRDQAIKNVVHSAFSNSGQKCSATSLLVLEEEVYQDPHFRKGLIDAAKSLSVGSVWDFKNRLSTVANPVGGALKKALETLEEGEEWALEPSFVEGNPYFLSPCIKWGVRPGAFTHMNELFGPVLSVMRAKDLKEAIEIVNMTGYGLTSGIESLDAREVAYWREHIGAGNLYINRGTTGAIVQRQPFGGMGKSAVGAGRKAGIHNYVTQFMEFDEVAFPAVSNHHAHPLVDVVKQWKSDAQKGIHGQFLDQFEKLEAAICSYVEQHEVEFSKEHDYAKVRGEDNLFRYLPLSTVALRVTKEDTLFEILSRILAAKVSRVALHVSVEAELERDTVSFLFENKERLLGEGDGIVREDDVQFIKSAKGAQRIIYASAKRVPTTIFAHAAKTATFVVRQKPLMDGRLELLNYHQEQSISHSYHRYGNLGARGL